MDIKALKKSVFKTIIIEHFLTTSAQALPRVVKVENHIALRVIWLICFLSSTAYCIRSITVSFQNYLSYPSYISTSIYQEIPTNFPAVTLCNMKTLNKAATIPNILDPSFILNFPEKDFTSFEMVLGYYILVRSFLTSANLTKEERKNYGYKLEDTLLSCYFNYEKCDASDFTYFFDPWYGNCYTFNKGVDNNGNRTKIKKVATDGAFYGLIMELFTGGPLDVETYFEMNDGFILSLHNNTNRPFTGGKIMIPTGADTNIEVERSFIQKLESPYGNCVKDLSKFSSSLYDYIVNTLGEGYDQKFCFDLCLQRATIKLCNCTNSFLPLYKEDKVSCVYNLNCMYEFMASLDEINDVLPQCRKECPYECNSIEYETSTSRGFYPTKFYRSLLYNRTIIKNSGIKVDDLHEAVAKVNVFYKSMEYKVIEQKVQTTTEDFFSSIGGTLSLYIGISLLSFVEIIEIFFRMIYACFSKKKKNNQIQTLVIEEHIK